MQAGLVAAIALALFAVAPVGAAEVETASGAVRGRIAAGIEAKDADAVRTNAALLAEMGAGLSTGSQNRIAPFLDPAEAKRLATLFAANAAPVAASRVAYTVPAAHRLIEGLAFESKSGRLFATSVADGRLLIRDAKGQWTAQRPSTRGAGLFGMALDAKRNRLWIASGTVDQIAVKGESGLVEIDARTLATLAFHPLPLAGAEGVVPGDVAIGPDGSVYVSDGMKGALYRCPPRCGALEPLLPPGTLQSAQGMAVSRDGKALIVADYAVGVARIDLATRAVAWLRPAKPAMLDGIDGLVRAGRDLIAIQNGTSQRRILRIRLDAAERAIAAVDILERANPEWGEPTLGTAADGQFLYVADAQWERYGTGGAPADAEPPRDTAIRSLRLR